VICPSRVKVHHAVAAVVAAIADRAASVVRHDGAAGSAREPLTTLRVDRRAPASFVTAARIVLAPAAADDSIGAGHSSEASLALAFGLASVGLAGEGRALNARGAVDLIGFPIVCHMVFYSSNRRADCHSLFI